MGSRGLSPFFIASKLLWFFTTPSNLILGLSGLGFVALLARRRAGASWIIGVAFALGLACGLGPVGNLLTAPLEGRFPQFSLDGPAPDGIIVLGGAADETLSYESGQLQLNDAGERITALVELSRRYPDAKLLFSGGSVAFFSDVPTTEADVIARETEKLGLQPGRLATEKRSLNTRENAVESARILQPRTGQRWLLVTSGFHMPRAMGCFRVAGFDVTAYPVDLRTGRHPYALSMAAADGWHKTDVAAREWIGLLVYRLSGYTDALLPASAAAS